MKWVMYWGIVALNAFDLLTTWAGLTSGKMEEGNPLLAWMSMNGIMFTKAMVLLGLGVILAYWEPKQWGLNGLYLATIIYALVVGINIGGLQA